MLYKAQFLWIVNTFKIAKYIKVKSYNPVRCCGNHALQIAGYKKHRYLFYGQYIYHLIYIPPMYSKGKYWRLYRPPSKLFASPT